MSRRGARAGRIRVEAAKDSSLQTQPWLFVIDAQGNVAGKFEGVTAVHEVEDVLARVLEGYRRLALSRRFGKPAAFLPPYSKQGGRGWSLQPHRPSLLLASTRDPRGNHDLRVPDQRYAVRRSLDSRSSGLGLSAKGSGPQVRPSAPSGLNPSLRPSRSADAAPRQGRRPPPLGPSSCLSGPCRWGKRWISCPPRRHPR